MVYMVCIVHGTWRMVHGAGCRVPGSGCRLQSSSLWREGTCLAEHDGLLGKREATCVGAARFGQCRGATTLGDTQLHRLMLEELCRWG